MGGSTFGGGGNIERPATRWEILKIQVSESPLVFWPLVVIVFVAIGRIFTEDPLTDTFLSMVTVTAFGTQWLGLVRGRRRMNESHWQFDMEHLGTMIGLNDVSATLGQPPNVTFLSPCKAKGIRGYWHRITKKRLLALYNMGTGRSNSFTKYIVSEKDWFYLQLGGFIDTASPERLKEGMEYLKNHKRISSLI